ncbi:MAG: hypothetical protein Q8N26_32020 [Myxococcales bacterium]|nr:hypothetical protein [Myxococcales bacterium]
MVKRIGSEQPNRSTPVKAAAPAATPQVMPLRKKLVRMKGDGITTDKPRLPSEHAPNAGRNCLSTGTPATGGRTCVSTGQPPVDGAPAESRPMSLIELMHRNASEHRAASLAQGAGWAVAAAQRDARLEQETRAAAAAPQAAATPVKPPPPARPLPPGVERTSRNWLGILTVEDARKTLDPRVLAQTEEAWRTGRRKGTDLRGEACSLDEAILTRANVPANGTPDYFRWADQSTKETLIKAGRASEIPQLTNDPRHLELIDYVHSLGARDNFMDKEVVVEALNGGVSMDRLKEHFGALVNKYGPRTFHYAHRIFATLDTSPQGLENLKSGWYTQQALAMASGGTRYA